MSRLADAWEAWLDSESDDQGTNDELAEAIVEATREALDAALAEKLDE